MVRSVPAMTVLLAAGLLAACSSTTSGNGSGFFPGASVTATAPASTSPPAPSATPPSPTSSATSGPRSPAAVARAVEIRATDLPVGWKLIPNSRGGNDSLLWATSCAQSRGVPVGSLPDADTPDFSPDGTAEANQVGTATGLFDSPADAAMYVAALRKPQFGECMATAATRLWSGAFRSVPPFRSGPFRVPTAGDAAGVSTTAVQANGERLTFQFFAIRVGPIVTMLNTSWVTAVDVNIINTAASEIGLRMRSA